MIRMVLPMLLIVIIHLCSFWAMTERKYSLRKTAFVYLSFAVAFVCFTALNHILLGDSAQYYAMGFMSTIIIAFFAFMFISADPVCKKVFLFISYANFFCIVVCFSLIMCVVFLKNSSEFVVYYARNIIRMVLFIPSIWIYIRFLRPTVRLVSGKRRKTWYSISFVSALFLVIFALFVVAFHSEYSHLDKYIPFFAIAVLIYCSILWVIFGTIKSMIDESNTELISRNIAYLQAQLKDAKEKELAAKTIRHDFRHHSMNIASMIKKGETEEALKYLEKYNDNLQMTKMNEYCPNVTVNAILNSFLSRAAGSGISVTVEADTKENIPITDMNLVAVLSNLLENAVNGCIECKSEGEIRVNIRTVADKMVIVCSNPCRNDICIEDNMIKNRGIGIASMMSAIRNCNGDIRYSLQDGILTACIILNF